MLLHFIDGMFFTLWFVIQSMYYIILSIFLSIRLFLSCFFKICGWYLISVFPLPNIILCLHYFSPDICHVYVLFHLNSFCLYLFFIWIFSFIIFILFSWKICDEWKYISNFVNIIDKWLWDVYLPVLMNHDIKELGRNSLTTISSCPQGGPVV